MQTLLQSLGVFFLILIAILLLLILGVVLFVVLLIKSLSSTNEIYDQAKNYLDSAIIAITREWHLQEICNRATPKMLESMNVTLWENYLAQCERSLGKLTQYKGSQGSLQGLPIFKDLKPLMRIMTKKSDLELLKAGENLILGEYIAHGDFERGVAKFEVQLVKQDQEWFINCLVITLNSESFETTEIVSFSFGNKTNIDTLIEENRARQQLEKLI
jgi:hypothetical protein